jgi:hypothetical protein
MPPETRPTQRLTAIRFDSGQVVVAPTDQWIACIFDVLHPEQQAVIVERIRAMAEAQANRPLIEMPWPFPQGTD